MPSASKFITLINHIAKLKRMEVDSYKTIKGHMILEALYIDLAKKPDFSWEVSPEGFDAAVKSAFEDAHPCNIEKVDNSTDTLLDLCVNVHGQIHGTKK